MFAVLSKRVGPLPVWAIGLALGGALFYGAARARGGGDAIAGAQSLVDAMKGGLPFNIGPGPGNVGMPGPVSSGGGSSSTGSTAGAANAAVGASGGEGASASSSISSGSGDDLGSLSEAPPDAPPPSIARVDTSSNPADPTTTDPLIKTVEGSWVTASQLAKTTVPIATAPVTTTEPVPTTSVSSYTYTPPANIAYREAQNAPVTDPHAGLINSRYGWVTPDLLAQLYAAENAARMERTQPPTPTIAPTVNGVPIPTPPPLIAGKVPGSGALQYPTPEAEATPLGSAQGGTTPREAQAPGYGGTGAGTNSLSGGGNTLT